jgi:predicted dehydrogenase/nucleoside-diphosphate-sugar epimerase
MEARTVIPSMSTRAPALRPEDPRLVSQPSTIQERAGVGRRRVALVGAGWIAEAHARILAGIEGVEITLVCDPDRARAEALARRFHVQRTLASVDEIGAAEIDVAHLLTPPDLHEKLARDLLERGIGVFVEKPLALSAAGARGLAELAARRGVALGANHNFCFHPAFVRLLEKVRAGKIGRVEHVRATLATPLSQLEAGAFGHWMFRAPANIVYEQAVHPLSLVHALVGRLESVRTSLLSTRELFPGQVFHDRWAVAARAQSGTAEVHLAFGARFEQFRVEVRGTDGCLEADLRRNTLSGEGKTKWLEFFDAFLASSRRGAMLKRDARRELASYLGTTLGLSGQDEGFTASMRDSIEAFHHAIANRAEPPCDARVAAEVLEWCDEIARAASPAVPPKTFPEPGPARAGEVIVLGASGFIGRRTVEKLLGLGLPVTAVVRQAQFLPREIASGVEGGRVRIVRGSLEDRASLERAIAGARVVIHLATGGGSSWEEVERSMVRGTVAAAEAAIKAKAERFVYVSSIAALDTGGARPIEDSLETDPRPEARPVYARGKIAAEKALAELHRTKGLPLVIVRPGVVLGAGTSMQHSGLGLWVRDNHCVGWGAGEHPLPLVWVDDVAEALATIAGHPGKGLDGKALNLAASVPLSAREVVAELAKVTGRPIEFHPRPLALSQAMEIGKWIVKRLSGRSADPPSWHDLAARSLRAPIPSRTAREVLGWKPVEDREAFLERAVRVHRRP